MPFAVTDIPPQRGRVALVTGSTSGIGYETALALAGAGATVILPARNERRGAEAIARIREMHPAADIRAESADLADLTSVRQLAQRVRATHGKLDLLINNAGVMTPPTRQVTADGFELQFGVNYLAHFLLTLELLPLLQAAGSARVVTLSSVAARQGAIDFSDLQAEKAYRAMTVYSQSKLACLIFARELQRRSAAAGLGVVSIGAHPGVARTELIANGAGRSSGFGLVRRLAWWLFQPAAQGALPTLFAATSPEAVPGGYYGPDKLGETRGYPKPAAVPKQATDQAVADRLWAVSEELAGVRFAEAARRG